MIIEVKVCDNCKHRNPVTAVECEKCGYDLTFAFPQKIDDSLEEKDNTSNANEKSVDSSSAKSGDWEMISIANENDRLIIGDSITVGRDCEWFSNQFNSSNYTSRTHAKLRVSNGKLEVMDASTNGTFVDEKRIPKMEWQAIEDGDTVRFADVSFKFRRIDGAD